MGCVIATEASNSSWAQGWRMFKPPKRVGAASRTRSASPGEKARPIKLGYYILHGAKYRKLDDHLSVNIEVITFVCNNNSGARSLDEIVHITFIFYINSSGENVK